MRAHVLGPAILAITVLSQTSPPHAPPATLTATTNSGTLKPVPSLRLAPTIWLASEGGRASVSRVALDGQLSLSKLSSSSRALSRSFALWGVGVSQEGESPWVRRPSSGLGLLLARVGYGLYLGKLSSPSAKLFVYYDHRHERLLRDLRRVGMGTGGGGGGLGVAATLLLSPSWGIHLKAKAGDNFFAGVSLVWRPGPLGP